ncbi:hypothetical protein EW145_g5560 [Phellinidium pouzarii]|uniref:Threonine/serine exporter-like N-terminal domain-containing protein n=1 Tax=Phellinidium pouzarii TaxID=167371 RepID=A0A4S4KZQ0_9AGAM|nr:hypothetical protein EW145_g5560 [Phellinidium pouzarii]
MSGQEKTYGGYHSRVASDPFTAIPTRFARQNDSRTRRASDAATTSPRANKSLKYIRDIAMKTDDDSDGYGSDLGPAVPPRAYDSDFRSPTAQSRAMYSDQFNDSLSDPKPLPSRRGRVRRPQDPRSDSSLPPSLTGSYKLPTYHQFATPPDPLPKQPFSARLRDFFVKITAEPPLPSPPPSEPVSRRNSVSGQTGSNDEYDQDLLVRSIRMNGDNNAQDSLAVDADVQLYGDPKQGHHEVPFFLQHIRSKKDDHGNEKSGNKSYKERRKKRKHCIVYNRDTADAQERFILTFARALLRFGSPSHRIEPQLESLASIFEMAAQFVHTPGCIQISFGLPEKHASQTLFIKSDVSLDLGRIHETHVVYRAVVRDEITASEGRARIEKLLTRPPLYSLKTQFVLTFLQGFVLCGSSFGGSLNDMWVAGTLSLLVLLAQMRASRSELSSSGTDILVSGFVSLVARALEVRVPNQIFCYQSISSTGVAGLLPGSIMLAGVLDIASKNIYLGSPKLVSGIMTSLYLGFGLTVGSDIWLHFDAHGRRVVAAMADRYETFSGVFVSSNETTPDWLNPQNLTGTWLFQESSAMGTKNFVNGCYRDPSWPWLLQPLPWYSLFVLLPVLNLVLSMKRAQPVRSTQMPVMVLISCTSTAVTQFANRHMGLSGHPDYTALLGSFVVSLLGNVYSRKMGGTAFTIMLTGIWLLIPTGLAEAGGLASSYTAPGEDEYTQSLYLARKSEPHHIFSLRLFPGY